MPLDTVLRRYVAGHALLGEFILQEAAAGDPAPAASLRELLRTEAAALDHLIGAVAREYREEAEARAASSERRRAERVAKLLAGELADGDGLDYELGGWHVGAILAGAWPADAARGLARALDCRLLQVPHGGDVLWVWLGAGRELGEQHIAAILDNPWPDGTRVACGEPGRGLSGWRLTHRQAAAALPVALRGPDPRVRYAEVGLLASVLRDEVHSASLRALYLAPLEAERDGGAILRRTLRAYLAAERNAATAAAALGVTRQTVNNRLRLAEERLGRTLAAYGAELEVALRLAELDRP